MWLDVCHITSLHVDTSAKDSPNYLTSIKIFLVLLTYSITFSFFLCQVSLLTANQATETANIALAEAQEQNNGLAKRVEDAEMRADQLQDNVQRLVS